MHSIHIIRNCNRFSLLFFFFIFLLVSPSLPCLSLSLSLPHCFLHVLYSHFLPENSFHFLSVEFFLYFSYRVGKSHTMMLRSFFVVFSGVLHLAVLHLFRCIRLSGKIHIVYASDFALRNFCKRRPTNFENSLQFDIIAWEADEDIFRYDNE